MHVCFLIVTDIFKGHRFSKFETIKKHIFPGKFHNYKTGNYIVNKPKLSNL